MRLLPYQIFVRYLIKINQRRVSSLVSHLMVTPRSIDGPEFRGGLGAIRYLNVPESTTPAPSYLVTLRVWLAAVIATFPRSVALIWRRR